MYYLYIFFILNIVYKDSKWYTCLTRKDIFHIDARHMAYMVLAIFSIVYKYDILYFTSNILCIYIYISHVTYMHHILLTYTSPIIIPHYVILPCENTSNRISSHIFFWYFLRDDFPQDLILKKQLALPGTIKALPGGSRITGLGPLVLRDQCRRCGRKTEVLERSTMKWRWVQHIHSNTQLCFAANIQPSFIATSQGSELCSLVCVQEAADNMWPPVKEAPSFTDLRKVQLPTTVFLCVEAIRPGKLPCCAMLSPDPAGQRGLVTS